MTHLGALLGATHVVLVEPNPFRRGQAEALGATVLSPGDDVGATCLSWLVTHRLPLSDVEQAVELLTGDAGKVLLSG